MALELDKSAYIRRTIVGLPLKEKLFLGIQYIFFFFFLDVTFNSNMYMLKLTLFGLVVRSNDNNYCFHRLSVSVLLNATL